MEDSKPITDEVQDAVEELQPIAGETHADVPTDKPEQTASESHGVSFDHKDVVVSTEIEVEPVAGEKIAGHHLDSSMENTTNSETVAETLSHAAENHDKETIGSQQDQLVDTVQRNQVEEDASADEFNSQLSQEQGIQDAVPSELTENRQVDAEAAEIDQTFEASDVVEEEALMRSLLMSLQLVEPMNGRTHRRSRHR